MVNMFNGATSFNQDLCAWNISNVVNMNDMFDGATSFNGDISSWNTSNVITMWNMFNGATSFNGDLSSWNISSVTDMNGMFAGAFSFNQDLCVWGDKFPYDNAGDIFKNSGCNNTSTPQENQKGPFCASDCAVSTFYWLCTFCSHIAFLLLPATLMPCKLMVPEQNTTNVKPKHVPETV
jgi:surface protein